MLFSASCFDCIPNLTGAGYTGTVSHTIGGITCQRWDSQYPHKHNATIIDITLTEAANHCRAPDGDTHGEWCYTTDPDVIWDYCNVPYCRGVNSCRCMLKHGFVFVFIIGKKNSSPSSLNQLILLLWSFISIVKWFYWYDPVSL